MNTTDTLLEVRLLRGASLDAANAPRTYALVLINPHWVATHKPTKERPLPPREVVIGMGSEEMIRAKAAAVRAVLEGALTGTALLA